MRKIILFLLLIIFLLGLYLYMERGSWLFRPVVSQMNLEKATYNEQGLSKEENLRLADGLKLLKSRRDDAALLIFTNILLFNPNEIDALWGQAEILRRKRRYSDTESLLNQIIAANPKHASSLISLSYIRYQADRLDEAQALITEVLDSNLEKDNLALAYLMLGSINSRRALKGWFIGRVKYGTQILCYLLKARELAPDLPEVHMSLGSFYLLAPKIIGGNLDKAIEELNTAVRLAPDFATANARLAQAYKKKGNLGSYNFYIQRVIELDPENEVLKEL